MEFNIEIKEQPEKLNYYEGDNFESKGLVVQANYNSRTNPSVILKYSDYSIVNGTNLKAGQKYVTISYQDKSINLPISVEKNSVIKLEIKNQPDKTEYKEGQNFDKTGMVIEAIYKNGTTKTISDYTIENGNNLETEQTSVTIVYDGQKIEQSIKVTPNPLIELKISKAPNKQKYVVGQNFDKTGMVIIGKYRDGSEQEIIDYTIEKLKRFSNVEEIFLENESKKFNNDELATLNNTFEITDKIIEAFINGEDFYKISSLYSQK